jgi:hypothetical protein
MIQYPITPNEEQQIFEKANKPVEYNFTDFGTGFKEENLLAIGINYLMENQDFPPDENYNPIEDQQLIPYANNYDMFMFSKSQAETTSIINKLKKQAETNYASPWYHLGRITGSTLDLSSLLLFTKVGSYARIFGTAFAAEEIAKQQLDATREDSYVPWVVAGGYGLPCIVNNRAHGTVGAATHH